ncbi:hypothetical protein HYH03_015060 [Edaphochlamys debaryana]|uniref:LamG domain-containing protein n=1 Tax=Edaphochlamys debaryana TaxID=47281 RepID=A0A836BRJ8_9CHLO|nr:hypothetical protein HYH03_015060 [Edaphochlamys debaryana]|eukprot:KAG2486235.1 hypothetical protein HYH03_015060 [Edaphochlamys debaryana]
MSTFAGKSKNSAPSSVLGGAVLALEACALAGAGGSAVASWGEFTQANSARRPVIVGTGGSRGGKYVSFTATSQQFMYLSNKQLNLLSGNGGTIACVVRFKTPVNQWERIFSAMTVADNKKDVISVYRYSNQTVMEYSFPAWVGVNNAIVNDAWAVYIMRYSVSNSSSYFSRNGTALSTTLKGAYPVTNVAANMGLGANVYGGNPSLAVGGNFGNIDMEAFYLWDRSLTDAECTSVYNYLSTAL